MNVERMAFVGAIVRDPARDGERLAEVLDTDLVAYQHDGAPDVPPLRARPRRLHARALPGPARRRRRAVAVWGACTRGPRCLALGLTVADQGVAERALDAAGVAVHHRAGDGRAVLVDGLPFPVVLTDRLLARRSAHAGRPAPRRNA